MPSYRYTRDIDPQSLEPETPPNYTRAQKASNWWHYHWKWLVAALAVLVLVVLLILDMTRQEQPDLSIGIMAPYTLPDSLVTKLEEALSAFAEDTNADGKVLVSIQQFTLAPPGSAEDDFTVDPEQHMASMARLTGALSTSEPMLFLLEPEAAQAYQDTYAIFDTGSMPTTAPVGDYALLFGELPVLAALDLELELYDGSTTDGHALLDGYLLGLRPLAGKLANNEDALVDRQNAEAFLQRLG